MNSLYTPNYGLNVYHQKPEELFEYASSHGLRHIEVNLSHKNLAIETFNDERISTLNNLAKTHKVGLSLHIPFYTNISEVLLPLRKTNIKYLLKCIELAGALHSIHVTFHVGSFYWFPVAHWARKRALKRFIKSLDQVLEVCEEHKVILALENVVPIPHGSDFYLLGDNITDFEFIFDSVGSDYLCFCLDTGHANMGEGASAYISHFKHKLCCVHYHDNNGNDDAHLAIGTGTVPWQQVAEQLKEINFQGPIISECRNIDPHITARIFEGYFNSAK